MRTKLLTLLLCLLTTLPALANTFEVDGIGYTHYTGTGDNTVQVTDGKGVSGSITIPAEVQYDGKPYSVTSIGYASFEGCTGLTSIILPNSIEYIGSNAFRGCTGLTSLSLPNSIKSIEGNAFRDCTGLTSIILPNSLTDINRWTFKGCTGLTSIILPNSITDIGEGAFQDCTGLTSITLPNSLTDIGYCAFANCTGLTSITLPNSLTSFGYCAFQGCTGLTSITLPNSITSIGDWTFRYCTRLTEIYCAAEVPPTCSVLTFDNVDYANCTLYVPVGAVETYRTRAPWDKFNIVGYDFAGVAEVSSVSPAVAYDLQGRRVSNPRRGIFIVNGQKQCLN